MLFSKTEGILFFAISTEVPRHTTMGNGTWYVSCACAMMHDDAY